MTTDTICARCRAAPAFCIRLCRPCGLRLAEADRDRRHRAERKQHAAERYQRLRQMEASRWQAPATLPEPEAAE